MEQYIQAEDEGNSDGKKEKSEGAKSKMQKKLTMLLLRWI